MLCKIHVNCIDKYPLKKCLYNEGSDPDLQLKRYNNYLFGMWSQKVGVLTKQWFSKDLFTLSVSVNVAMLLTIFL